jgi:hypothetical protein
VIQFWGKFLIVTAESLPLKRKAGTLMGIFDVAG